MTFLYIQTTQAEPGISSTSSIQASTTLKVLLSPLKGPHCSEGVRLRVEGTKRKVWIDSIVFFILSAALRATQMFFITSRQSRLRWTGRQQKRGRRGVRSEWFASELLGLCDVVVGSSWWGWTAAVGTEGKKESKGVYKAKGQSCFSPFSRLIKYSSMWLPAWLELPIMLLLFGRAVTD